MSTITAFQQEDFDVFAIDGLDQRMEAIKGIIRPKLEALGQHFAPALSVATGSEMFFHVAKHARRTVNPPLIHGLLGQLINADTKSTHTFKLACGVHICLSGMRSYTKLLQKRK